jgi:predicted permease
MIYGFLLLGWAWRKVRPSIEAASRGLSRATVLLVETPTIVLVYWGIENTVLGDHLRLAVIALLVMSLSGAAGWLVGRLYRLERRALGTYTVAALLSNNGPTLGGFLCLLYLGDEALELSQIFTLFAVPYFFTVVFLTARSFAPGRRVGLLAVLRANFGDPISILPNAAMAAGLLLSILGVPYPVFLHLPRTVLVFAAVILYSTSFGIGMHMRSMFSSVKPYLGMLPVKFLVAPLVGTGLGLLFGYSPTSDALAFKTLVIQSSMPVAIWSVVACKLFALDDGLAVGLWIFTTACVAVLLPLFGLLAAA